MFSMIRKLPENLRMSADEADIECLQIIFPRAGLQASRAPQNALDVLDNYEHPS